MREVRDTYDVGVIVGRFQVPDLHDAHEQLIQHVCDEHDKVIIFLGLSPLMVTTENPLDFESRKQMILDKFPHVNVLYIKDVNNDELWSKRLDSMIEDITTPAQSVVLYGGRDSFINHYTGKHDTRELAQDTFISGSELRRSISRKSVKASADFRAGVVWAAYSTFPTVYTTVDVAILDSKQKRLLVGKKADEKQYRFIGGFADPGSESFEGDARREVMEEAGIEVSDLIYLGSTNINDWRYRKERDKIRTLFFLAEFAGGDVRAGDDLAEVHWIDVNRITPTEFMPNHQKLVHMLLPHLP